MRILLVEDEWMIREVVAEVLTEGGFEVRETESGDHAAALITEAPTAFSLLMTDVHMPGRLNGIDIAQLFRAHRPEVPVIYMTARPDALNGVWSFGVRDALLQKPFVLSRLLATTRRLLSEEDYRR